MQQLLASRHALIVGLVLAVIGALSLIYTLGEKLVPALSIYADFVAMAALVFLVWTAIEWFTPTDFFAQLKEGNVAGALWRGMLFVGLCILATAT